MQFINEIKKNYSYIIAILFVFILTIVIVFMPSCGGAKNDNDAGRTIQSIEESQSREHERLSAAQDKLAEQREFNQSASRSISESEQINTDVRRIEESDREIINRVEQRAAEAESIFTDIEIRNNGNEEGK